MQIVIINRAKFLNLFNQKCLRLLEQAFLIEEIKKFGLINDNNPHRMLLLSTNLALFGNVGYKNECTWTYFMDATSHAEVSREIYERILDTYGLTYQYISEFTKLEKLLEKASKEQTLLQVFFCWIDRIWMKSRTWHGYVVFLHMKKQSIGFCKVLKKI